MNPALLFGSRTHTRAELRQIVEAALGARLEEHDSLYWGEYETLPDLDAPS